MGGKRRETARGQPSTRISHQVNPAFLLGVVPTGF
jgi:hypothetical protein